MIGRKKEIKELERLYDSGQAEFVAVYGRRRVGKTYLVSNVFENRFSFRHAGLSPVESGEGGIEYASLQDQLDQFLASLRAFGWKESRRPKKWIEAFSMLARMLEEHDDGSRQLVFIDELPWLDTPRSGFITALEGFWNSWACFRKNFMLVVSGSASSWMLDKLINNHGGLYGRLTSEIKLSPFTLGECEDFFRSRNVLLSRYDITQSWMIFGGIPYYLSFFSGELSLAQNVDALFFSKGARLKHEFTRLFASVFAKPGRVKEVVEFLARRSSGYTRKEIVENTSLTEGIAATETLNALVASDFVISYVPFGQSQKDVHYKLIDPFCLFYLRFVAGADSLVSEDLWLSSVESTGVAAWKGLAFENLCFSHIPQLKKALGISGVRTVQSAWTKRDGGEGAQIDLLIDRSDNVVNLCELKFYSGKFHVTGDYSRLMQDRDEILRPMIGEKKVIHNTLVTTYGIERGEYSSTFSHVITLDDLFA